MKATEIEPSGGLVLECERCGEEVFLLGLEEDWRSEGRTAFGCSCGEELTLDDHLEDEERKVRRTGGLPSGAGGGP